jgi:putative membrane protein
MLALSLHIAFIAVWSASLVYFPLLFMEQSQSDSPRHERLMLLQRWIYSMVMTPSALLAIVAGTWLVLERGFSGGWMPVKLALVLVMVLFHGYCGALMVDLKRRGVRRSTAFYGALSAVPTVAILAVVTLVSAKPF